MTVLAIGGLLVEAGGTAWAEDTAPVAGTQSAPLLLAQAMPVISSAVLGETGAPVVSILQPNYADLLKGKSSVVIGVNASHAGPQTVEMFLDGLSATGGPKPLPGTPTTEFKFDTTLFTDGAHRLKVKVTDALGFIGQSETTIYINNGRKVDVTPPLLRWLNVQSGDLLRGDVKFRLQASDNFGIKWVFVKVTPAATPNGPAVRVLFNNRPPYDFDFDTTLVPDGVYSLSATAKDAGENEGRAPATFIAVANRTLNPTEFDTELSSAIQSSAEARTAISKPKFGPVQGSGKVSVPLSTSGQAPASSGARTKGTSPRVAERPDARSNPPASTNTASSENAMTTITRRLQPSTSSASSTSSRLASRDSSSGDLAPYRIGAPTLKQRGTTTRSSRPGTALPPRMSTHAAVGSAMTIAPFALPTGRASTDRTASRRAQNDTWSDAPVASKRRVRTASMPRPAAGSAVAVRPRVTTVRNVVEKPLKSVLGAVANPIGAKSVSPSLASRGSMQARVEHSNPMRVGDVTAAPRPSVSTRTLPAQMSPPQARITLTPMMVDSDARISANGAMQEVAPLESTLLPRALPQASGAISQPFVAPRSTAPRVAALPPVVSTRRNGPAAAITVAPLSSDNALPMLHVVARGETLGSIAARWKVPSAVLAASNNLKPSARVLAGTTLRLPRPLKVSFGGKPATGDVTALMVGSTSVTPFRFLFEQQGGSLEWDAARQRVVARNATQEITLTIGSRAALVNRQQVMMDLAAFLLSGRTMVPVRFFEKALHAQVDWEPVSGRLYISMAPPA